MKMVTIALLFIGGVALLATGCARKISANAEDNAPPQAVRMASVELAKEAEPTKYSAVITPNAQVDLAFRVPGYVVELYQTKGADGRIRPLEAGALVPAGTVLACVRANDYQAGVDKARGVRAETEAGVRGAEAQVVEANAGLAEAELDFERVSKLWEQESTTKPVYDGSKARLDAARAKVDSAQASVVASKQRMDSASAQLWEAKIALGDTELRAPFAGVLLERRVELGTLVNTGVPAFVLADLQLVKGRLSVPDSALHNFTQGQPVDFTVDAFPGEHFKGRVLSLAASADPRVRSFEVEVSIANPALKLRSGMIASVQVGETLEGPPQLQIPVEALVHDPASDSYLVYTIEQRDGKEFAKAIPVRPGPLSGSHVLVLDGLTSGRRIVVSGANLLRPGKRVQEID